MMRYCKTNVVLGLIFGLLLAGCSQHVSRIVIQNKTGSLLRIETSPIITSKTGAWEKGISYYKKDSIIWRYRGGYQINAKILSPNYWISERDANTTKHVFGEFYADYPLFSGDTTVHGQYLMYPESYLPIGEFFFKENKMSGRDSLHTNFNIKMLKLFTKSDTLISDGSLKIFNMLWNFNDTSKSKDFWQIIKKKKRDWVIEIK